MKPFYTFLALLAMTCVISSCKREKEDIPPANEGTILTAYTSTDRNDQLFRRSYVRNTADKLIQYRDSLIFPYDSRTFEYDADGKVSKVNIYNESGVLKQHFELEYNNNGKVIKRVNVDQVYPARYNTYTYNASGKLVVDSLFIPATTGYTPASVTKLYYTGDNVTEAVSYASDAGVGMYPVLKIKYEYDNGLNPLKNIPNYYCLTTISGGIYYSRYESKNNVKKEYHAIPNQPYGLVFTYTYKYNSSNYPYRQVPGYDPNGFESAEVVFFYK